MNILDKIVERKIETVTAAIRKTPESVLREHSQNREDYRPFFERLKTCSPGGANIIAEIKRASPSKGEIRPDLDPVAYARAYEQGGAACLSVLTDQPFFMGSDEDLTRARAAVSLPVLRKDFTISTYQIHEAAALGADAVLLIVRILTRRQLQEYLALCRELKLDALVEIHTEADMEIADWAGAQLIGINNRNLRSFDTDTQHAIRIAKQLSPDQVAVAASGIKTPADVRESCQAGLWNFLIGESLVRSDAPAEFLRSLREQSEE